jgi:hypothetical protein
MKMNAAGRPGGDETLRVQIVGSVRQPRGEGEVATEVQTVSHLRNDVDAAVVQGLPDAQIEIDFQTGLLLVKFVWQTDTQQVVR